MKETEADKIKRLKLIKETFQNVMPVNKMLGMIIEKLKDGYAEVHVPFQKQFVGDFKRGLYHGGILASVADTAGGLVAYTQARNGDQINTVDMRIDYLHGALESDLHCIASLVKTGNRIILADVNIFQDHQEEPVAVARCAYSIKRN